MIACTSSPRPGGQTTIRVSATRTISTSDCPAPTVSTMMVSKPAASSTSTMRLVARDSPPRCPREATERTKTFSWPPCSAMRTRSPSTAPPEIGLEGRPRRPRCAGPAPAARRGAR
ncbi:MAG: hypothetical protein M5U08_00610 [Burkholderiales bacterium]|nr:hypothetical protein [Burkholderiales bacterium]